MWEKDALNWALERFDYIIDSHSTPDFVEFIGSIGGDTLTFRYYQNGNVVEK